MGRFLDAKGNEGFTEERLYWDSASVRGRRQGLPGLHPPAASAG